MGQPPGGHNLIVGVTLGQQTPLQPTVVVVVMISSSRQTRSSCGGQKTRLFVKGHVGNGLRIVTVGQGGRIVLVRTVVMTVVMTVE